MFDEGQIMHSTDFFDNQGTINERYLVDWSGVKVGYPSQIFRPTSTEEVSAIVRRCHSENRRITVQGGLTGVAGGATPSDGDVVINLERMNQIEDIDALEGVMQVQAGALLQEVQEAALANGWMFAVDLGARGSCHIGGNAATNAGGIRVIRYGPMRDSVLGVEAVLADGTIVSSLTRAETCYLKIANCILHCEILRKPIKKAANNAALSRLALHASV